MIQKTNLMLSASIYLESFVNLGYSTENGERASKERDLREACPRMTYQVISVQGVVRGSAVSP